MSSIRENIKALTRQLYPTGRAFKMPLNGWFDYLNDALILSENRAYLDAIDILNSILPDNSNFSADDATDWERRLGIISSSTDLEDRKLAIKRKMQHPGDIPARQHYLYLQGQLQAAGFNVYVFENVFSDGMGGFEPHTISDVIGFSGVQDVQHGDVQHGDAQHGGSYSNIIVNYIDEEQDSLFYIPSNLKATFFIGGEVLGDFANVPIERKNEFRQLILTLKPVQMVGYLLINYV